jgi:acyl carrier protein
MKEQILEVLSGVRPEANFREIDDFIGSGLLDSFDIVLLVSGLEKAFQILIPGELVIAKNFRSLNSIEALLGDLTQK